MPCLLSRLPLDLTYSSRTLSLSTCCVEAEARRLLPWGSQCQHVDVAKRGSEQDHSQSVAFEDACEGPPATRAEIDTRIPSSFDPTLNTAVIAMHERKARPCVVEQSMTFADVVEELQSVKTVLEHLVRQLEQIESRPAYLRTASFVQQDETAVANGQELQPSCGSICTPGMSGGGCSWTRTGVLIAISLVTLRYAHASPK